MFQKPTDYIFFVWFQTCLQFPTGYLEIDDLKRAKSFLIKHNKKTNRPEENAVTVPFAANNAPKMKICTNTRFTMV